MLVSDVLALAAENMAREDLSAELAALAASEGEPSEGVRALLRCYRLVESEVALDYCPLRRKDLLSTVAGRVQYAAFPEQPVDVIEVTDTNGRRLAFTLAAAHVEIPAATDLVEIEYTYAPQAAELDDAVAFPARVSARLLSMGVCAEFLLTAGRYAEAEVWEGKFREALRAAGVFRKKLCAARSRRWA